MQKVKAQPELPTSAQTRVANVGGCSHAYLSYLLKMAAEDEKALLEMRKAALYIYFTFTLHLHLEGIA